MKQLNSRETEGPRDHEPPPLTKEQRETIESELGQKLASVDAGRTLKRLIIEGAEALARKQFSVATKKYRAARALCEATGLEAEGLLIGVSLGTSYFSANKPMAAEATYREVATKARTKDLVALESQALLGLGCTRMFLKRFDEAKPAYERILELTTTDSPLHTEAKRMIAACTAKNPLYGLPEAAEVQP